MLPSDNETLETSDDQNTLAEQLRAKRLSNAAIITRRREAAQKWQEEHRKNIMLFPSSYDFS